MQEVSDALPASAPKLTIVKVTFGAQNSTADLTVSFQKEFNANPYAILYGGHPNGTDPAPYQPKSMQADIVLQGTAKHIEISEANLYIPPWWRQGLPLPFVNYPSITSPEFAIVSARTFGSRGSEDVTAKLIARVKGRDIPVSLDNMAGKKVHYDNSVQIAIYFDYNGKRYLRQFNGGDNVLIVP